MTTKALEVVEIIEAEIVDDSPLSPEERQEHTQRIERIHSAMYEMSEKSIEIWKDLQWIKDNRTYREEYDTFQDFCKNELGKDNSQIYRHLKDAELKEALLLNAASDAERSTILGLKEGNTRYIRTLPEEIQIPFWKLAYGMGMELLSKKDNGAIEPTTAFMETVGSKMNEIVELGGCHIDGQFVSLDSVVQAAQIEGVDEASAKAILLRAGVSEDAYEALQRQADHIREKSVRADTTLLKGTVQIEVDINGSEYPVLIDSKGNEYDLFGEIMSYNNRFISLSIKAPIRDN